MYECNVFFVGSEFHLIFEWPANIKHHTKFVPRQYVHPLTTYTFCIRISSPSLCVYMSLCQHPYHRR